MLEDVETIWTEMQLVDELVPHAGNPKAHDIEKIKASIRRFGFTSPVMVDERTGVLVAGHGRVIALKEMQNEDATPPKGIRADGTNWYVPVLRGIAFNSDAERDAYLIADNRLTELGGWDDVELVDMLKAIKSEGDDVLLGLTGYDNDALQLMIDELVPRAKGEGDEGGGSPGENGFEYVEQFAVTVVCADEAEQKSLYDVLVEMGYTPKVVVV